MKTFLTISFAALALICGSADATAQILSPTSTSNSDSNSRSRATSNSNSSSSAGVSTGSTTLSISQPSTTNANQPTDVTVRAAPQVYVPNVVTGNACALGASAGASFIGTGIAIGGSWESMQCERRQTAALLFNMNTPESRAAAKEVLCNSPEIRASFRTTGSPCAIDMPPPTMVQQPAPPIVVTPAPQPMVMSQPKVYPRCSRTITDNCIS